MNESIVRDQIQKLLDWGDAHLTLESAIADLPAAMRGTRASGIPHSVWELVEHIRITQADVLDFCVNPDYVEIEWPREYWPDTPAPPSDAAWEHSIGRIAQDRETLKTLASDPDLDLTSTIPHGSGQTYLRELLLVPDHTSYHVGQIVAVRRALGAWDAG